MALQAPDFELIFAPGARHELRWGDVATVRLRQGASLWLPSGRVVASELFMLREDDDPFIQQVPPGQYPLVLVIADCAERGDRRASETVAAARLVIRDEPVVSWEMAVCDGQDLSGLDDDGYFGYPVDGGSGGFIDAANIASLLADDDEFDDLVWSALGESRFDGLAAGTVTDEDGRPLAVVFASGGGDGCYPTWVGRTAGGEVGCFLTDFLILTGDEGKDAAADGDGERLPGKQTSHAGAPPGPRPGRRPGTAALLVLGSCTSLQVGAAFATRLFPVTGAPGVTLLRLTLAAVLPLALGTAVLASVVPYTLELAALRRAPRRVFGILLSLEPAVATLAGWPLLGQRVAAVAVPAVAVVMLASAGAAVTARAAAG